MDADISPAQIKSVFSQLQGKPYDSKTFKKAKLKLSAFITENREKLPDMEQINMSTDNYLNTMQVLLEERKELQKKLAEGRKTDICPSRCSAKTASRSS